MNVEPGRTQPAGIAQRLLLVWLVLSAIALAVAAPRLAELNLRGDDALRLVQVRDLIGGQAWFDLRQYRIDPAAGPLMHWSRLVDAPIALVVLLLTPLVGQPDAEMAALVVVPLLTLGVVVAAVGVAAGRLFGLRVAGLAALSVGLLGPVLFQLQPTRIDHHGWQVAAIAVALLGFLSHDVRLGGIVSGIALGIGMTISLEALPVAAIFAAIYALRWMREAWEGERLAWFLFAMAATLAGLYAATLGPGNLSSYCDAIGPAHIAFFIVVAAGTFAATRSNRCSPGFIAAALGATGLAGLTLFGTVAPDCMRMPFGALDPLVRDYWYLNVGEGRPIWVQDPALAVPAVIQLCLALVACALMLRRTGCARRWLVFDYLLLLVGVTVLALLVWRSMAFAGVIAAIPLGWLVAHAMKRIESLQRPVAKVVALAILAIAVMPAIIIQTSAPLLARQPATPVGAAAAPARSVTDSSCRDKKILARFAAVPTGTAFAQFDVGPAILLHTPHAVAATGHHRAEQAMRETIAGMLATPDEAESIVRARSADYVVLCRDISETAMFAEAAPDGLAATLRGRETPDWLEPLSGFENSSLGVWRVRQAARKSIATPLMQ